MGEIDQTAPPWVRGSLGVALMIVPVALLALLYGIWPDSIGGAAGSDAKTFAAVFGTTWNPSLESRLMLIVLASGALGSYVHAATSFATYVGNAELHKTWIWWYVLRPFVGSVLAFVLYSVTRGGLLTQSGNASVLNPFGVAAVAGMTGMFSKQAVDKLQEMFDSLFRTGQGGGDDQRTGKLTGAASGPPEAGKGGAVGGVQAATGTVAAKGTGDPPSPNAGLAGTSRPGVPAVPVAAAVGDGSRDGSPPSTVAIQPGS